MESRFWFARPTLALLSGLVGIVAVCVVSGAQGRTIALSGTSAPRTIDSPPSGSNDVISAEFLQQLDEPDGPGPFGGTITNRSLSKGHGKGPSVSSGKKAKSNPVYSASFDGLNHYQQRYSNRGNQFSLEPPDQALCVGNGYVVEAVNDVLNVYDQSGASLLPDNTATNIVSGFARNVNHAVDLNSFYGYAAAVNRTTGALGPEITDPSCLYDAATQRFFLVVLTLDRNSGGGLNHVNHLDIAVSATSDPTGSWNIYKIDVTNDGTNTGGVNPGPYLGDYPHIGADTNGFYITTNAYPWCCNGFAGAQIYALSKSQLAAGAAAVNVVHLDTSGLVNAPSDAGATQPGFTVWPAQSPDGSGHGGHGGTEFFLSSNAADEATHPVAGTGGNYTSTQIVLWTLTNTSSLDSAAPSLGLSAQLIDVGLYAIPPKQTQPGSGNAPGVDTPQGHCINDTTTPTIAGVGCWRLLFNPPAPAHDEVISRPDSNDTRMQQVVYANGKVWGALDTAINPDALGPQRAGITYFVVNPNAGKLDLQGYLGATGFDFSYPAVSVTQSGRGVITFTASGDTTFPSAAMASLDAKSGAGPWSFAGPDGEGAATDDGFTSYKSQVGNPPRTRWGDYGAVAVDGDSLWIASEYIADPCDYATWGGRFFGATTGDNLLGTCAATPGGIGSRTALANWATRITKFNLK